MFTDSRKQTGQFLAWPEVMPGLNKPIENNPRQWCLECRISPLDTQGAKSIGGSIEDIAGLFAQVAVLTGASIEFLARIHSGATLTYPGFAAGWP
jgi:hypothetical protein